MGLTEKARAEEQARYDEADIREQNKREKSKKEYRYKKKENKQEKYQEPKQEKPKTYSRWDSSNPYEVLGIDESATTKEIKKAYRNLAKIYHPDLTFSKKEEYTVILQKINKAYEVLK